MVSSAHPGHVSRHRNKGGEVPCRAAAATGGKNGLSLKKNLDQENKTRTEGQKRQLAARQIQIRYKSGMRNEFSNNTITMAAAQMPPTPRHAWQQLGFFHTCLLANPYLHHYCH